VSFVCGFGCRRLFFLDGNAVAGGRERGGGGGGGGGWDFWILHIICTFGSFIPSVCASLLPALTFL